MQISLQETTWKWVVGGLHAAARGATCGQGDVLDRSEYISFTRQTIRLDNPKICCNKDLPDMDAAGIGFGNKSDPYVIVRSICLRIQNVDLSRSNVDIVNDIQGRG